jgi:MAE_28990/MAE_18760-like HEPN
MQTVLLDFNTRVTEINDYFSFVEDLLTETMKLATLEESGIQTIMTIDSNLSKTLKANGFLLLYNLVESSMRNAIEAIFDELQSQRIPFDAVRVEIKKVVLQNFKNRSPDDIHNRITDISIDIIVAGFKSSELFSGNIDRREIVKTARKYGFSFDTDYSKTRHGENLSIVMKNRNDLAHGNKSFTEVGKDISIEDIRKVKEEVIAYISQILNNIETYLDAKEYLDVSQDTST